jgi:hypothetical protein
MPAEHVGGVTALAVTVTGVVTVLPFAHPDQRIQSTLKQLSSPEYRKGCPLAEKMWQPSSSSSVTHLVFPTPFGDVEVIPGLETGAMERAKNLGSHLALF